VVADLVDLLWEVGGWALEGVVDAFGGGKDEERPAAGEAPHLPLPDVEYHERANPPR